MHKPSTFRALQIFLKLHRTETASYYVCILELQLVLDGKWKKNIVAMPCVKGKGKAFRIDLG